MQTLMHTTNECTHNETAFAGRWSHYHVCAHGSLARQVSLSLSTARASRARSRMSDFSMQPRVVKPASSMICRNCANDIASMSLADVDGAVDSVLALLAVLAETDFIVACFTTVREQTGWPNTWPNHSYACEMLQTCKARRHNERAALYAVSQATSLRVPVLVPGPGGVYCSREGY